MGDETKMANKGRPSIVAEGQRHEAESQEAGSKNFQKAASRHAGKMARHNTTYKRAGTPFD